MGKITKVDRKKWDNIIQNEVCPFCGTLFKFNEERGAYYCGSSNGWSQEDNPSCASGPYYNCCLTEDGLQYYVGDKTLCSLKGKKFYLWQNSQEPFFSGTLSSKYNGKLKTLSQMVEACKEIYKRYKKIEVFT